MIPEKTFFQITFKYANLVKADSEKLNHSAQIQHHMEKKTDIFYISCELYNCLSISFEMFCLLKFYSLTHALSSNISFREMRNRRENK